MLTIQRKKTDSRPVRHSAPASRQTSLPSALKNSLGRRFGSSLDEVKLHYNSEKPAAFQAEAFTRGSEIYFSPGAERHLCHELGHVIQQKQEKIPVTGYENGQPVNTDPVLETRSNKLYAGLPCTEISARDNHKQPIQFMRTRPIGSPVYPPTDSEWHRTITELPPADKIRFYEVIRSIGEDPTAKSWIYLSGSQCEVFTNEEYESIKDNPAYEKNNFHEINHYEITLGNTVHLLNQNEIDYIKRLNGIAYYNHVSPEQIGPPGSRSWISCPTYATGDLTSVCAYALHAEGIGVALFFEDIGSRNQKNSMALLKSFLGGETDSSSTYILTKKGLKGCWQKKRPSSQTDDKSLPLSIGTLKIAEGYDETWKQEVRTAWGVQPEGQEYQVRTAPGTQPEVPEYPYDDAITAWLGNSGLKPKESIFRKQIAVFWIRKSGERGGAHYEHDTSFRQLEAQLSMPRNASFDTIILAGDEKDGKAQIIAQRHQDRVFNFTEIWSLPDIESWGGNTRTGQFRFYDYLNRHCARLIHVGAMSGNLEAMALLGHEAEVHAADAANPSVRRMLKYTAPACTAKRNGFQISYPIYCYEEILPHHEKYEKKSAIYFKLLKNATRSLLESDSLLQDKELLDILKSFFQGVKNAPRMQRFVFPRIFQVEELSFSQKKETGAEVDTTIEIFPNIIFFIKIIYTQKPAKNNIIYFIEKEVTTISLMHRNITKGKYMGNYGPVPASPVMSKYRLNNVRLKLQKTLTTKKLTLGELWPILRELLVSDEFKQHMAWMFAGKIMTDTALSDYPPCNGPSLDKANEVLLDSIFIQAAKIAAHVLKK